MSVPTVETATAFIRCAHAGQVDKGGAPYWLHPVSVMKRLGSEAPHNHKLVALLHDVLEDTPCTTCALVLMGYPAGVIASVALLTKPKGMPYLAYIESLVATGDKAAIAVKIADNEDNLDPARLALLPADQRGGAEKYRQSLAILRAAN